MKTEIQNSLKDVAHQNRVTVSGEIQDKFNLLLSIADEIHDTQIKETHLMTELQSIVEQYNFKRMGLVDSDGMVHTTDGYEKDLSFREFYQDGMKGLAGITNTLKDSIGNYAESINVFSVPVYDQTNTIIGVLFATYRTAQFENILDVSSFDGDGFTCIVAQNGDLIASSPSAPSSMRGSSNLLSFFANPNDADISCGKTLNEVFASKENGLGSYESDNQTYYYCVVPLDNLRKDRQWYNLTIVPEQVLVDRSYPVMHHVRRMLIIVFTASLSGIAAYMYTYHLQSKELVRLAYKDTLTDGDNYVCFKENVKHHVNFPGFYVALDLSEFKIINATCGVNKGDTVLKMVWEIIVSGLRSGEYAAHIHADRFILLLKGSSQADLETRLDRLVLRLSSISVQLNIPKIFPVMGIYQTSDHNEIEQNYGKAVQAKHTIKATHSRHYAFYDELDMQQLAENKQLEDSFEEALQNGEFKVWYQPKVNPDDGTLLGAEALIRWQLPDGSMLPPYKFIPLFEQNGNIAVLDEYVFRTVCEQQKKWLESGADTYPVSVNISRVSLYFTDLVGKYKRILDSFQLDPKYVQLEITESATVDNTEISSLIEDFHHAGFTMLLDDFGSGYSSLSTLNVMHFDTIKLDKSLIDYIGDTKGEKLLHYITRLAQSLGMSITAEGVETASQVDFLKDLHCSDIQGYFFSKPLPLSDYEAFAIEHTKQP
ncbi:MAG: GGDEF domain-containing protein [Eubacteriales bacterium]|nr:GGDEF domain-containing protein [Eubacteriales bacterium]